MPRYRPIKEGSQVETLSDKQPGIVRAVHPSSGQVDVEFTEGGMKRLSLALIQRRKRLYTRKRAQPVQKISAVAFQFCLTEVVKKRMSRLGLTYDTLAQRSGVSRSSLYRMLNASENDTRVSTLEAVARALQISPREFWTEAR